MNLKKKTIKKKVISSMTENLSIKRCGTYYIDTYIKIYLKYMFDITSRPMVIIILMVKISVTGMLPLFMTEIRKT